MPLAPRRPTPWLVAYALAVSLTSVPARAALDPIPGEERFAHLPSSQGSSAGAEIGVGQLEEDWFLNIAPRLDLSFWLMRVGLQVPLRLRIVDETPKNDDDIGGVIRKEDWDEWKEYLRVIRYVQVGQERDLIYARLGELAAQIGHGTIMSRYMNNLDFNTYRLGLELDVNTNYGGVETVVSDVPGLFAGTPDSRILGVRGYFKPVSLWDAESMLNIFSVGATSVTDFSAPLSYQRNAAGEVQISKDHKLRVQNATEQTVFGFDLEAEVLNNSALRLVPYYDVNFITEGGWGMHLGTLLTFSVPIGFDLTIPMRLEYRRFARNYLPIYYNTFYDVGRYAFPAGSVNPSKAAYVRDLPSGGAINGVYGDLALDFAGYFQIGAIYEGYEGQYPNLEAFMAVPALDWLQFKAYYARTRVADVGDLFALDDRSMVIVQARYQLVSFLYLVARWSRRWVLETDPASAAYGEYQAEDAWNAGLEAGFSF